MADIRLKKPLDNQFQGQGLEEIYQGNDFSDATKIHGHGARAAGFRNKVTVAASHIYSPDEIDQFQLTKAYQMHPLAKRPVNIRSKLAYKEILNQLKPTTRYLLPGQLVVFEYLTPKYKDELEFYDKTPMTLFVGCVRTQAGLIREIGVNFHMFPPHTRVNMMNKAYEAFKPYFNKYFNEASTKPNTVISWQALKHIMKTNQKLAFGIKMYIPTLRSKSFLIPTRLIPTALYTEGHMAKKTMQEVFRFWREF